nr:sulfotransferase family 2 domain-containing protein [Pseudomonas nitroreducens]
MWTFHDQGFGYIQIPKVATRSIRAALGGLGGLSDESSDRTRFADFEQRFSRHLPHHDIRRSAEGLLVFAFVRDPLARLYSAYVNKIVDAEQQGLRNILRCHGMRFGMSFEDFVVRTCELDDRHIDRHLRSQAWFLTDGNGTIPGFIGRMESFAQDWNSLRDRLPCLGPVGHHNKAVGKTDYRQFYSDRALELVARRYARDIELFDYRIG